MIDDPLLLGHPGLGQKDGRIAVDRVVALEIETQEERNRLSDPGVRRQVHQQVHRSCMLVPIKGQAHLLAVSHPVQCACLLVQVFDLHFDRPAGSLPVDMLFEEGQDFSPARAPTGGIFYLAAIRK